MQNIWSISDKKVTISLQRMICEAKKQRNWENGIEMFKTKENRKQESTKRAENDKSVT